MGTNPSAKFRNLVESLPRSMNSRGLFLEWDLRMDVIGQVSTYVLMYRVYNPCSLKENFKVYYLAAPTAVIAQ